MLILCTQCYVENYYFFQKVAMVFHGASISNLIPSNTCWAEQKKVRIRILTQQ